MALISIVVPIYNAEKHLQTCLNSITEQTLKDIEIILVNDGSIDESGTICASAQEQDKRIKIINKENEGAWKARNIGLAMSTGRYVLFLDSDDFFELNMCEAAYEKATACNADIVLLGADVYNEADGEFKESSWLLDSRYLPEKEVFNCQDNPDGFFLSVAGGPCNKLFRRDMLIKEDIQFPSLKSLEDVPFVYTALACAERICVLDKVLQHYRKNSNEDSLVNKAKDHPTRIFESFDELGRRLSQKGFFPLLERSFINRACSDFIDQYEYVLKSEYAKDFYKRYYYRVIRSKYSIDTKDAAYFIRSNLYNRLKQLNYDTDTCNSITKDAIDVSVIMPVYNVEEFLYQSINSILDQSLQNFELILVDDESTDGSLEILREYSIIDNRITVLEQKNQYAGAARNTGMSVACGKYLLFLDPDDFFENTLLEELYDAAIEVDADIVLCDGKYFNNVTHEFTPAQFLLQRYNIPDARPFSYREKPDKILHISIDCPWNKLFKREFINKNNLQFQTIRSANDVFFVDSALLLADRITIVDKKLVNYRTNIKTSLQATRSREPLNFYEALTAVRNRMISERRFHEIERSLISLFITGCRTHLERAKDGEEFLTLYDFYRDTAFKEWGLLDCSIDRFVYVDDKKWIDRIASEKPADYLLQQWRNAEAKANKQQKPVPAVINSDDKSKNIIKYYRSYKLGCAITFIPRKIRGGIRCLREHGVNYTLRRAVEHFGIPADAEMPRMRRGITKNKRSKKIIVSLTSYPGRINLVHKAIESLLVQTEKPDEIILWLSIEQFPNKEKDLPKELKQLRRFGLTIKWCNDIKSHKKYYWAMQEYPNDLIVTVDDDLYYAPDLVERLYSAYRNHPDCVCAARCHMLTFNQEGEPNPYRKWKKEQSALIGVPSMELVSTSGAGTLFPPNCMDKEVFNREALETICLNADDIWLKTMQILKGTKTVQAFPNRELRYVEDSQTTALWHDNVNQEGNDRQLAMIQKRYGNCWSKSMIERL